jgi:hypothetical protein
MKIIEHIADTDDAYVEIIRHKDRTIRRARWAYPFAFLMIVFAGCWFANNFRFVVDFAQVNRHTAVAFGAGVLYAGAVLFFLAGAIDCVRDSRKARNGYRAERLMLKYYDALHDKGASNNTPEGFRRSADGPTKPSA